LAPVLLSLNANIPTNQKECVGASGRVTLRPHMSILAGGIRTKSHLYTRAIYCLATTPMTAQPRRFGACVFLSTKTMDRVGKAMTE
jgi:hypothetical protein